MLNGHLVDFEVAGEGDAVVLAHARPFARWYLPLVAHLPDHAVLRYERPAPDDPTFGIADDVQFAGGERKALLKRAASAWLPADVLTPRKKGFGAPVETWLARGLHERAAALVEGGVLVSHGLLDARGASALLATRDPSPAWLLFAAELWARHWLEPSGPPLRELLGAAP